MEGIRTIFITGGAGYVGCNLIPKLLKKGYHVKILIFISLEKMFWMSLRITQILSR